MVTKCILNTNGCAKYRITWSPYESNTFLNEMYKLLVLICADTNVKVGTFILCLWDSELPHHFGEVINVF